MLFKDKPGQQRCAYRFNNNADVDGKSSLIVYMAVGEYNQIGLWPDDENVHSRWETMRYIAGLMQDGISPDVIFDAVQATVGGIE